MEIFCNGTAADGESDNAGIILSVTRPTVTRCPPPPANIAGLVKPGWENIDFNVEIRTSMNVTASNNHMRAENFNDTTERVEAFTKWRNQRQQWKINEWPVRQSATLFQTIYEWFGICERAAEQIELLLGDGLLNCPDEGGNFNHQILLQRVELEFDPGKNHPQFTFRKRDRPPELYLEFLRALPGANYRQVANCAYELKKAEFSPVGGDDTSGFPQKLIQGIFPTGGRMVSDETSVEMEKRSEEPQGSAVTTKRKAVVVTKNGDL